MGEMIDAYIRVSAVSGREGASYISPSVQREQIERWAAYKGVTIDQWHLDEDWSGGASSRPGLDAAVERAVTGQTNGIVAAKIDRFSRLTEQGLRDLRRLSEVGARLSFVAEDIDTSSAVGKMVYTIMLAQAEYFLEQIKASWVTAKRRAVERGAYISRTPFGYQRNPDGTLSPHPERGPIVTEAFRLAAGRSLHAAMSYLARTVPERDWTTTKVRRLLGGRSYLGETRNGGVVQADTHEPLVSRAVWEAAQSSPSTRKPSASFPLSGLLRCGTCGAGMIGSRGGKGQRTYRCSNTLSTSRGECSAGAVVTAELVEAHLRKLAVQQLAGLRVIVSHPEADNLTLLERAVNEAEQELDAFAADLTLRRALGDRYHQHLQSRLEALEKARGAYREQARKSEEAKAFDPEALLASDDPQAAGMLLRSIFAKVIVVPGRGLAIGDRLRLIPFDADSASGKPGTEQA